MEHKMGYYSWIFVVLLLFLTSNTVQGEWRDQEKLGNIALKTIESEDGDVIHCVDIYKQPAFDNPLLQNHTIEMTPSINPFGNDSSNSQEEITQLWHKNGSCPEGTVPIRRTSTGDHPAFMSLTQYLNDDVAPRVRGDNDLSGLEFAGYTSLAGDGPYTAIKGRFSVSTPRVLPGEVSGAFIVVRRGINMAFLGWEVRVPSSTTASHPPRLLIVTTGARRPECSNGHCNHFIHTSRRIADGAALNTQGNSLPVFQIYKDNTQQKWWAAWGNEVIGYWPTSALENLETAEVVSWSGFVYNSAPEGQHTATEMGNGQNPNRGLRNVAFIDDISLIRSSASEANAQRQVNLQRVAPFPRCYSATLVGSAGHRRELWSLYHSATKNQSTTNLGLTMYYGGRGEPGCDAHARHPQPSVRV